MIGPQPSQGWFRKREIELGVLLVVELREQSQGSIGRDPVLGRWGPCLVGVAGTAKVGLGDCFANVKLRVRVAVSCKLHVQGTQGLDILLGFTNFKSTVTVWGLIWIRP